MRKILVVGLMIALLFLVACSQDRRFDDRRGMRGPMMDMSDEERQAFMEERMRLGAEACEERIEGDSCTMTSPRGEMQGTCNLRDDVLSCMPERPEGGRMPPDGMMPPRDGQRFPSDGIMPPPV